MTTKKIEEIEARQNVHAEEGALRKVASTAQDVGKQHIYARADGHRQKPNWPELLEAKKLSRTEGFSDERIEEVATRFQKHGEEIAKAVVQRDQRNDRRRHARRLGTAPWGDKSANER